MHFFRGAIEKKRPMGVWLERADHDLTLGKPLQANHYKVHKLYVAEQPVPYSGDSLDARARIVTMLDGLTSNVDQPAIGRFVPTTPYIARVFIPAEDCAFYSILNVGEIIQFNHRGELYRITQLPSSPTLIQHGPQFRAPFNRTGISAATPANEYVIIDVQAVSANVRVASVALQRLQRGLGRLQGQSVPFQIFRRPRRTMGAPIEMPNGTVIDLMLSGVDADNASKFRYGGNSTLQSPLQNLSEVGPAHDVVIMFDEFGKLDKVYYMVADPLLVPAGIASEVRDVKSTSISLFIGRDELVSQGGGHGGGSNKAPLPGDLILETDPPDRTPARSSWVDANLGDTSNIWLSISGSRVTNAPNAGLDPTVQDQEYVPYYFFDTHIRHARQLTRSGLSMGEQ
ncbi:hypothetical protein ACFL2H_13750 [Planctomycetota bacterium]